MLEVKNLYKVYRPKKGVPVTALNRISITFPEKGMVFLLGKSGSGKSTLLNLLGGLEKYDDGDIIIKGVSSKKFGQQHFDSYRNTYVGFIFQEYNVLDEFSVGANIALAIELQGRKASDEEINNILKEVDLEGYGNRKPNELSGGQKQRVAIARALVKNPEIIMADEPTGALDSNTGKQIFDTLKKLSKDKLVIVVSHDREFSEQYADRIIELADGSVINDVERAEVENSDVDEEISYEDNVITVKKGYHITTEDLKAINEYLEHTKEDNIKIISVKEKNGRNFVKTDTEKIEKSDGSGFKLIKSRLPLRNAVKIGAGALKHKKFRLVMTILLSCISFGLFGLSDTFGSYNHVKTCTNSVIDSKIDYLSFRKSVKVKMDDYEYWMNYNTGITENELKTLEKNTGVKLSGVYVPAAADMSFSSNYNENTTFSDTDTNIYAGSFTGYMEITEKNIKEYGYELLAGNVPQGGKNEAAISEYVFETFKKAGYTDNKKDYVEITNYEDMIGKNLEVNGRSYKITGIVDTGFDFDRYASLMEENYNSGNAQKVFDYVLYNEWYNASRNSFAGILMLGENDVETMIKNTPYVVPAGISDVYYYSGDCNGYAGYVTSLNEALKTQKIKWLDGDRDKLGEKEIIVNSSSVELYDIKSIEDLGSENIEMYYNYNTYESGYKIVGVIENDEAPWSDTMIVSDEMYNSFIGDAYGEYEYVVGVMPSGRQEIAHVMEYCYENNEDAVLKYEIQNAVTYELSTVNDVFKSCSKVFFYIGLGFAGFAALMLANFIGTSIAHKKQEIGILRAIGSRGNDVFRIFFSESFIIAMVNFVLSTTGVAIVTTVINNIIRKEFNLLITVLDFGIRQILLLLAVSVLVAFVASFIPVKKIASKRPIDAIRNR